VIFTYFPPRSPLPDQTLDNSDYAAAHCKQTKPGQVIRLPAWVELYEWITMAERPGRKGDAGYIIAGACETTRKEGGPAPFCLIDYDDAPPDWAELDAYEGFAWTTASHTADKPAWRVLIPFTAPMAHGKLHCPFPGAHIRNRTQPAFLPTGSDVEYRDLAGMKRLDPTTLGKPAEVYSAASSSMIGAAFQAAGWVVGEQSDALIVRCPWQHEHTGGKGGGTVVFHDNPEHDGRGKFECQHGHCDGRTSAHALDILKTVPAAVAELAHWPEPTNVLAPYTRADAPPVPAGEGVKDWASIVATPIPPLVWINEGLRLAPGRPSFIVSAPNVGKSWSIQTMAVEMAAGLPVFGAFPGPAVPVMFVTQDSCHIATAERFQILNRSLSVSQDIPLFWYTPRLQMIKRDGRDMVFDPKGLIELRKAAADRGCRVVILDSLFALLEGVDPNSPDIGAAIRATNTPDVTFIWTHHTSKATDAYYGSQAIAGAMGVQWVVTLAKPDAVDGPRLWTCRKRPERISGGSPKAFRTTWQDSSRVAWIPEDEPIQGERPEDRIAEAILFVMANAGLSGKEKILERVRGKGTAKRLVWDDLLVKGMITHVGQCYKVAAGVGVAKERPEGVRDEDD
jgi:hypothetical protein